MMKQDRRSWTDDELRIAISSSISFRETLNKLGIGRGPGNYNSLKRHIERLELDISHFKGKSHGTALPGNTISLELLLTTDINYSSSELKRRLVKAGLLQPICAICGLGPVWNNIPISLQLDHINGDSFDNRLENLRILCPNCHSQTPTFRRSKTRYSPVHATCRDCGKEIHKGSARCSACHGKLIESRSTWPPAETLIEKILSTSLRETAKSISVSDNGLKKYIIRSLGYWPKLSRGPRPILT